MGLILELSRREVRVIDSLMDELAQLVPKLRQGDGYCNVFVDEPPGYIVDHDETRGCPFLMRTRTHGLCSIHHLALRSGRAVESVKPAACRHWPVTLVADGARVRVTVQEAALTLGCVAPRRDEPGKPTVLAAFRAEIEELCGPGVWAAARRRRPARP